MSLPVTDEQAEHIKKALANLVLAKEAMKRVTEELKTFGEKVPSLSKKATELFCGSINEINFHLQFSMSFVRVSTLQQFANLTETKSNERQ